MGASSGLPSKYDTVTWTLRRTLVDRRCAVTRNIIWPFQKAWRKRKDFWYGGEVFASEDTWVTKDQYIILKLKGETEYV